MCDCGALDCPRCFPESHHSEEIGKAVQLALQANFAAMLKHGGKSLTNLIGDCFGNDRFNALVDQLVLSEARQGGELAELLFAEYSCQHEDDISRRITS